MEQIGFRKAQLRSETLVLNRMQLQFETGKHSLLKQLETSLTKTTNEDLRKSVINFEDIRLHFLKFYQKHKAGLHCLEINVLLVVKMKIPLFVDPCFLKMLVAAEAQSFPEYFECLKIYVQYTQLSS